MSYSSDVSDEIQQLFDDEQQEYASAVARDAVRAGLSVYGATRAAGIKTSPRKRQYDRAYHTVALHEKIRQRILSGERPKRGGVGRPPTRWLRVAASMGIDLNAPPAAPAAPVTP